MTRRVASVLTVALLLGISASAADEVKEPVKLFNGKDFTGWKKFLAKGDPNEIWSVKDGVIVCEGSVPGYLITEKDYSNYVLELEWRWGKKVTDGRNSGVFVHVSGPDEIWPKGVEAQLMADRAGDFWLVGKFKLDIDPARKDPRSDRHYFRTKDKVEKPVGEWNKYRITCKDDTVALAVNGQEVNSGKNAEATKGKILLQSEGAEIHFRNIELKPVK